MYIFYCLLFLEIIMFKKELFTKRLIKKQLFKKNCTILNLHSAIYYYRLVLFCLIRPI